MNATDLIKLAAQNERSWVAPAGAGVGAAGTSLAVNYAGVPLLDRALDSVIGASKKRAPRAWEKAVANFVIHGALPAYFGSLALGAGLGAYGAHKLWGKKKK